MEFKLFDSIEEMKKVLENKKPRLVRANDERICIVLIDNSLMAFKNECPHMGESLHKGHITHLKEIVCPLHAYRFNIQSGESAQNCNSLRKVKVIQEKEVWLVL